MPLNKHKHRHDCNVYTIHILRKYNNNNAPMYLCDLIPPSIQSTTVYPLRNGSDIIMPFCRLSNTYDSFIPSTIRLLSANDSQPNSL
jgi:hypothetical protein